MNILLVDDDRLGRVMLAVSLRARDVTVCEAESGEEALLNWQRDTFDCVVSDILMPPGIDGLELAAQIRADEAAGPTQNPARLIALTASITRPEDEARIRGLFDAVLHKPIPVEALLQILSPPASD